MKILIDTEDKTITVMEDVNIGELFKYLESHFTDTKPMSNGWRDYKLIMREEYVTWGNRTTTTTIDPYMEPTTNPFNTTPNPNPFETTITTQPYNPLTTTGIPRTRVTPYGVVTQTSTNTPF
jgi:hypothetical protein